MSDKISQKDKQIWGMPVRCPLHSLLISTRELGTASIHVRLNHSSIALDSNHAIIHLLFSLYAARGELVELCYTELNPIRAR